SRVALLKLKDAELLAHQLEPDESRDVIDMLMNIDSLEAAVLFREDAVDEFKLSLRSKGHFEVLSVAESLGGGGHMFAAGAFLKGSYESFKSQIIERLTQKLKDHAEKAH